MTDFLDVIETISVTDASGDRLFGDAGTPVRSASRRALGQRYDEALLEAARLVNQVFGGSRRAAFAFEEAMTTSDFPLLFGDVLDRMMVAKYTEAPAEYRNWVKTSTVRDFRKVERFSTSLGEGLLEDVAEKAPYPATAVNEAKDEFRVAKKGRRIHMSWETLVNDDLDAFRSLPEDLALAARRSEALFATQLYVDSTGPHASLYDASLGNVVTGNPVLSTAALQTAFGILAGMRDEMGLPIVIDAVELVVPPALSITADNILNALQIEVVEVGGTANQKLIAANWMRNKVTKRVDPFIPYVASSANGNTSWFLFANVNTNRAALEMGWLRGHESPALFAKRSDSDRIGGGGSVAGVPEGDFDTDSHQLKVRACYGGTRLLQTGGYRMTVASEGDGT